MFIPRMVSVLLVGGSLAAVTLSAWLEWITLSSLTNNPWVAGLIIAACELSKLGLLIGYRVARTKGQPLTGGFRFFQSCLQVAFFGFAWFCAYWVTLELVKPQPTLRQRDKVFAQEFYHVLRSHLPGGPRKPAPELDAAYTAALEQILNRQEADGKYAAPALSPLLRKTQALLRAADQHIKTARREPESSYRRLGIYGVASGRLVFALSLLATLLTQLCIRVPVEYLTQKHYDQVARLTEDEEVERKMLNKQLGGTFRREVQKQLAAQADDPD